MSIINYVNKEIQFKIVYYGPGLCGKTTNLQYIYDRTNPSAKGKLKNASSILKVCSELEEASYEAVATHTSPCQILPPNCPAKSSDRCRRKPRRSITAWERALSADV